MWPGPGRSPDSAVVGVSWSCKAPCHFQHSGMTAATVAFVVIWLVAAAANTWIGVSQEGHSFQEELPLFLSSVWMPAALAISGKWKSL